MFDSTVEKLLSGTVDTITVTGLKQVADKGNLVLLDSREKREFEVSHLKGAAWVGYNDFDLARLDSIDTASTIVIYCSVGYRSEKVGEKLKAAGYSNVLNLYGGIFEWVNQSGEVYNTTGETDNVHGYDEKWSRFVQKGKVVLK